MTTTPPSVPEAHIPESERKDRRGKKAGEPGRGNTAYVPTEEVAAKVRTYAKSCPPNCNGLIAAMLGISESTLRKYYQKDLTIGRAEMVLSIGAQIAARAQDATSVVAKGDPKAQEFYLKFVGQWAARVELTGKNGKPIETTTVDLTGLTPAALREYGRQAAIREGLDPDEVVGPPLEDDE